MNTRTHAHTHMHTYTRIHTRIHTHAYTRLHTRIHTHTHTHAYTSSPTSMWLKIRCEKWQAAHSRRSCSTFTKHTHSHTKCTHMRSTSHILLISHSSLAHICAVCGRQSGGGELRAQNTTRRVGPHTAAGRRLFWCVRVCVCVCVPACMCVCVCVSFLRFISFVLFVKKNVFFASILFLSPLAATLLFFFYLFDLLVKSFF